MAELAPWKPARRWRIAKHVGCWGALVLAVAWPLTMVQGVTWIITPKVRVALYGGSLNTMWESPPMAADGPGLYFIEPPAGALWLLPEWSVMSTTTGAGWRRTDVILPLWMGAVVLGVVGVAGWWKCRGKGPGMCQKCGYDLRGTPGVERCPECGSQEGLRTED